MKKESTDCMESGAHTRFELLASVRSSFLVIPSAMSVCLLMYSAKDLSEEEEPIPSYRKQCAGEVHRVLVNVIGVWMLLLPGIGAVKREGGRRCPLNKEVSALLLGIALTTDAMFGDLAKTPKYSAYICTVKP